MFLFVYVDIIFFYKPARVALARGTRVALGSPRGRGPASGVSRPF